MNDDQEHVRLPTRLYAGKDDDLIEWLNSLPHGQKSDAVKEALRRGIDVDDGHAGEENAMEASGEAVLAGLNREALAEIRRIVETAVESALQQHGAGVETMPSEPSLADDDSGDDEAEEILSRLDAGVTLD